MKLGTLRAAGFQHKPELAQRYEWPYPRSVPRLFPALALVLAYAMTPGAGELTENAVHLVMTGHTAHAAHQDGHEPRGDEHGCSGPFHVCSCHGTAAFVAERTPIEVQAVRPASESVTWVVGDLESDGIATGIFRPPIA